MNNIYNIYIYIYIYLFIYQYLNMLIHWSTWDLTTRIYQWPFTRRDNPPLGKRKRNKTDLLGHSWWGARFSFFPCQIRDTLTRPFHCWLLSTCLGLAGPVASLPALWGALDPNLMSGRMSDFVSECQIKCQTICQVECQTICQNNVR